MSTLAQQIFPGAPLELAEKMLSMLSADAGSDEHVECIGATTANITLSGTQTIDGVSTGANKRWLVKNQSTASENGVYMTSAGAWTRATDADGVNEITNGFNVYVASGTVNANSVWTVTTADPIVIGTTNLTFAQTGGALGGSPAAVTKAAASAGTSNTIARSDHKHDITTAAAGAGEAGASAAEGSAASLARSDHAHSFATAAPADVTKDAAADGVATSFSRSDHKHDVSTAAPLAITGATTAVGEGAATSLARSDHAHVFLPPVATGGNVTPMAVNTTYIATAMGGAAQEFTLPAGAARGDMIRIVGYGTSTWKVRQEALVQIHNPNNLAVGSTSTTVGVAGTLTSANKFDSVLLYSIGSSTNEWIIVDKMGLPVCA